MIGASASLLGVPWMTTLAEGLARGSEHVAGDKTAKSIIILWMQGGPSQLETFDPHAGTKIGGDVKAISTSIAGIQIADTLPQTAEQLHNATLIRSITSKEGDHERATYNLKTGWRPDPTLVHPSIGSVICHQSESNIEIPRHVSILPGQWPARGGYLGSRFNAFQLGDPKNPLPNLVSQVESSRQQKRLNALAAFESDFKRGRIQNLDANKTLHETSTAAALKMMSSDQISAFDVMQEPDTLRNSFGDHAFGRGCLTAIRLIETGVRCVEVELSGWDTHAANHDLQSGRCQILDSALAQTLAELKKRDLLDSTIVYCGGEFGRTPQINPAAGRDHWPTGFSTLLAGGPFRRGYVHGETSADPNLETDDKLANVSKPVPVEDLHATLLSSFGINFKTELDTPVGRPLAISKGQVVSDLLAS
jgi:hypothetical protein